MKGDRRSEEKEGTAAHLSGHTGCWTALPAPKETDTMQNTNAEKQRWSVPSGGLVP